MARPSNDSLSLEPRVVEGGRGLELDFPELAIGSAEYDEGPTGCTVLHFPRRASAAVDVRGGSPGWSGRDGLVDAICLAGGSAYGLEALSGVRAELLASRAYSTDWLDIALVGGAIVYDFGGRDTAVYPDAALGRAALRAARPGRFPLGPRGAGRSATVGKLLLGRAGRESAGQGAAFRRLGDRRIAVFTVVNAVGAIVDRRGRVVRGNRDPATGQRGDPLADLERALAAAAAPPPGNTTLTVVVTNQPLGPVELAQLGRQVHASMARAIQPFHALNDGDVLFAVTTGSSSDPPLPPTLLATLASELAWDAVLSCWQD